VEDDFRKSDKYMRPSWRHDVAAIHCHHWYRRSARVSARQIRRGIVVLIFSRFRVSHLVLFLAGSCLAGCVQLPPAMPAGRVANLAVEPTMWVVTTRKAVNGARADPWFGSERANQMSIARVRLASPVLAGRFSLAATGLVDWQIEQVERVPSLSVGQSFAGSGDLRDVLLYVHGYNQTFASATLDAARLAHAVNFHGDTLLFSWPSSNKLLDYLRDRESALWSRDAFETALESLLANPNVGHVHIVAHSMGSMLTIEGLRQIYARHADRAADKMGAIVFASPDLDIGIFTSSVGRMRRLAQRMTIVIAADDRALAVAGKMAGTTRVGSAEKARLEALGLTVIDATGLGWGILNHDLFLRNARVQELIERAIAASKSPRGDGALFNRTALPSE
jgi:esterase/lipase superfamily enzyme